MLQIAIYYRVSVGTSNILLIVNLYAHHVCAVTKYIALSRIIIRQHGFEENSVTDTRYCVEISETILIHI